MRYPLLRTDRPRLYRTPDDPDYRFPEPEDPVRQRIRANILGSCEEELGAVPPRTVPQLVSSPYPHHNLYLCFYNAMTGQTMVEQFAFGYLLTRDPRYAEQARRWVRAILGWDYTINTFYSSARIMHALAVAEDWLGEELSPEDREGMHAYNAGLCRFHEQTIDELRKDTTAGGHSTLYPSHFGVAALSLLGIVPEAETWLDWVIEKFERALLPYGVAEDGTYPPDGNWALGYALYSRFLFMDALKNVTGIDLYEQYHDDVVRPLQFLRHAYVGGRDVEPKRIYGPDENLLTAYWQLDNFSPAILKLAAVARDPYAQWIGTRDPNLGKIQHTDNVVRGGSECNFAWGPFGYLWYDPSLGTIDRPDLPPSRLFPGCDYVVMRSGWEEPAMVVGYQGRRHMGSHDPTSFVIHWGGRAMTRRAPAPNTVPLPEGNAPAMSEEMELFSIVEQFTSTEAADTLRAAGFLTTQEFILKRGPVPYVLLRVRSRRRTPNEARLEEAGGERFLRLGPGGYLQYPREGNFCPDAGAIRIRFRFRFRCPTSDSDTSQDIQDGQDKGEDSDLSLSCPSCISCEVSESEVDDAASDRPRVLVGIGTGLLAAGGSSFHLGFLDGRRLAFDLRDHQGRRLRVTWPEDAPQPEAGEWHEVIAWWKGLNASPGGPMAGLRLGEHTITAPPDLPPGTPFTTHPNTSMWVGAAVQIPGTDARVDIQRLEIFGPEWGRLSSLPAVDIRQAGQPAPPLAPNPGSEALLFDVDYAQGLDAVVAGGEAQECAEGPLELRMHPHEGARLTPLGAELSHGHARLHPTAVPEGSVGFDLQPIPYAQAGLASGSFVEKPDRFQRLIARPAAGHPEIALALLPPSLAEDREFRARLAGQFDERG